MPTVSSDSNKWVFPNNLLLLLYPIQQWKEKQRWNTYSGKKDGTFGIPALIKEKPRSKKLEESKETYQFPITFCRVYPNSNCKDLLEMRLKIGQKRVCSVHTRVYGLITFFS